MEQLLKDISPQNCSINEFNTHLKEIKYRGLALIDPNEAINLNKIGIGVYVSQKVSKLHLFYKDFKANKIKYFITDLNGSYPDGSETILQSACTHCKTMGRIFKFARTNNKGEGQVNASGFLGNNPKYEDKIVRTFEYDKHLAWGSVLRNGILPDCSVEPKLGTFVGENEIGFLKSGSLQAGDICVFNGWADFVFPIYHQTQKQKDYLDKLNDKINNSTGLERQNYKNRINYFIGSLQNKSSFVRVAIISQSNKEIQDLKKKYNKQFVFSVTDSFGSTERLPELEATDSKAFGGWALKREGLLLTKSSNRFWLDDDGKILETSYRGMPEAYMIGKHYTEIPNILRNPEFNLYRFDLKKGQVVLNG